MITRSMRQQLLDAGFPPSAISTLQPAAAQKIIADKITFVQFEELQKQQQVELAAERAKQALRQEEQSKLAAAKEAEQEHDQAAPSAALVLQHGKIEDDVKTPQS
ncbi:hypothetical protein PC116_g20365 [Phytophthora cactorum]|nr:hypothetical protein PC112_g16162 [Phytophthora cactorum]KAG2811665.1 hypothetical protein PC111_g15141 [Phytophthora cactorum]KAG2851031.1 hypothetical protein PC113_g16257 [Phytophthora cactorum]KAG2889788.1 hypothetical protein PC114_g17777 [Phytophthora cactorum]KAG2971796.1 hypothetical protein PC118_g16078 [Phytophthora cactorum]